MTKKTPGKFGFYEFFAGGGFARLGLGPKWQCLFANDFSDKKARAYRDNFDGGDELLVADVARVRPMHLPSGADLAWASFPCQDLSLAGNGGGLSAARSGTFVPFWKLMKALNAKDRGPSIVVIENVVGLITSKRGADFRRLLAMVAREGYRVGPLVIDAVHFLPQSRPRLFIVAVKEDVAVARALATAAPNPLWHPRSLINAYAHMPQEVKSAWVWWSLPAPPAHQKTLADVLENEPADVRWHTPAETARLLSQMSAANLKKVKAAQASGGRMVGAVYKRTRRENGKRVQRAEVRFDGISGCLRTPAGGSSRQLILVVEGQKKRSRLISSREAARLMGVSDSYRLPARYNEAYHLMGDGLAVLAVSWLERHLLRPLAIGQRVTQGAA